MKMRMICIRIGASCEYLKYCKWEWEWFAFRAAFAIGNLNNNANANENDSHSAEGRAGGHGRVWGQERQSYKFYTIFQL